MKNLIKAIEYRDLLREILQLEEQVFGEPSKPAKPAAKAGKRTKEIDAEKILSLNAVGWKLEDIARDCKCEVSTVEKVIKDDADRRRLAEELAKG